MEVPQEDIYELIGIISDYRLLGQQAENGKRIEVWSKYESVHSFSFDLEDQEHHVVKLCFDDKTGKLLRVLSGEEHESEETEIGLDSALHQALKLMFKLFPNAHECFRLETLDEEVVEDVADLFDEFDEEIELSEMDCESYEEDPELDEVADEYIDEEPTYTFYFHSFHKGVRVDQHVSYISVGRFTGKVRYFYLDTPTDEIILQFLVTLTPVISVQEEKEIYRKYVQMELMFVREYAENGESIYSLAYTAAFPDTVGHVRAIDAITGKAMYVDVGDAMFFG